MWRWTYWWRGEWWWSRRSWISGKQIGGGNGEFWWDNENFEEEAKARTKKQLEESFQAKSSEEYPGCEDVMLQEWFEIEESLWKDGETCCTAKDIIGQGKKETLLAEWALIEEELEADKVFDQYAEISCQRNSENVTSKVQDIINRARLEIQEVVKTAVRNIYDIQQQHASFSDLLGSFSPSGEKCVTQEENFDHGIGCPSDDHFCSWEPRNIHVTYINSPSCIEPVVTVVDLFYPGADLGTSAHNNVEQMIFARAYRAQLYTVQGSIYQCWVCRFSWFATQMTVAWHPGEDCKLDAWWISRKPCTPERSGMAKAKEEIP